MRRRPLAYTPDAITAAWFSREQLDAMQRAERDDQTFQHMLRRREVFEERIAGADPLTATELRAHWDAADRQARGENP